MLPQFYQFILVNNSGQTVTFNSNGRLNLKITAWIIDPSTGKITYTQLTDNDFGFVAGQSMADGAERQTDVEFDNTGNLYVGLQVQVEVTR